MFMYRTRFKKEILAEFLPPYRPNRAGRVILLFDGVPGMPSKQSQAEFLSRKGFWVIHPRYRGTWESGGKFLRDSPERDLRDILDELPKGLREVTYGKRFPLQAKEIFVMGASFGGALAILSTLEARVKRAVAFCPVVDWRVSNRAERKETSNPIYPAYIKEAFGEGYRLKAKDWAKLRTGRFYNPAHRIREIDPSKVLLFHAQDDPVIPWKSVASFADQTGSKLFLFKRGGHLPMGRTAQKHWGKIRLFLK